MIHCLHKSRNGLPVNLQLTRDGDGLRFALQEGGASTSNSLSRFGAAEAFVRSVCALFGIDMRELGEALQLAADEEDERGGGCDLRRGAA